MEDDDFRDEEGHSADSALTGFLFGNIDKQGKLEDDILDEESKKHLSSLTVLGIGRMVKEITDDGDDSSGIDSDFGASESYGRKSDEAIDYSDITEVADEEDENAKYKAAMAGMQAPALDGDDYDSETVGGTDKRLMPPPSWIPDQGKPQETRNGGSPSKKKLDTPLAAMLPPELADKDVREWFPEFRPGQVLRFSRLFKPVHKSNIWKRKKKPKSDDKGETKADSTKPEKVEDEAGKKAAESSVEGGKEKSKEEGSSASQEASAVVMEDRRNSQEVECASDGTNKTVLVKEEGEKEEELGQSTVKLEEAESEEEEEEVDYCPFKLNMGREARPEEIMVDDEIRIMCPEEALKKEKNSDQGNTKDQKPKVAEWRYGPAQLWYDMLGVDEAGEDFDYGFKIKDENDDEEDECTLPPYSEKVEYPDDAYHMVTQLHWEDDIIWNADDVRTQVLQNLKRKGAAAGWIPTSTSRTLAQYMQQMYGKNVTGSTAQPSVMGFPGLGGQSIQEEKDMKPGEWFSIFPVENDDLLYGKWEDDIIWDAQSMKSIPEPPILTLDPNDENIILKMPEEEDEDLENDTQQRTVKEKMKDTKRSRILLGKAGILKGEEEEEEQEEEPDIQNKDPFNISNDEYYNPKLATDSVLKTNVGILIQHSNPAVELRPILFPTHMGPMKLRQFHRNLLKRYSHGPMSVYSSHPVHPLLKTIKRKAKMREQERLASGGGDMFFMRTLEDLTGRDGDIILAEYSEEFPPLMMQVGMATKIKNYYKRKPGKDAHPPEFQYGELAYAHTSPFLGSMVPGQCLQAFENNMFRAPIYQHSLPHNHFLIIRTRMHYYIRELEDIFSVGQQSPLIEVPGPNSKKANNFIRDFLQVYIYRLFIKSKDIPRRIKMEEIKKAFPSHSESSIRKRLKLCADFKRTGMDSNWWVIKPDFRLPTEEEMRNMVAPEQCCAYYSMVAAEQRLKDAGYGEKNILTIEEDNDDDSQVKMDDEVRAAPWNTTRAYIHAMKGKCLLALTGVADPTGSGEGFSYIKVPNKPSQGRGQQEKQDEAANTPAKKTVTGTDADLRRLPLKDAKNMLRKFGVPETEIKKLSRWEVIDVVRTMSTEQAKQGQDGTRMSKFARGNRFSVAEHQERYKEECQRIFDLQNRILGSGEMLSTDEEDTEDEEDSDFEEMGKNIENILSNKKTTSQLSFEREEAERKALHKMLQEGDMKKEDKKKEENARAQIPNGVRKLKITRTFKNEHGHEYTRTEIVRKSPVIDAYMKIRQTKDAAFIRQFATLDDAQKEEMKKERRRIQEQLRRIRRNQEKDKDREAHGDTPRKKKKKKDLQIKESNRALKCGACGQVGHMRTNKECPVYTRTEEELNYQKRGRKPIHQPSVQVAITEEQEEELARDGGLEDKELVKVEGTKMKLSKELIAHADKVKKKALTLKIPKAMAEGKRRRRAGTIIHCDYLKKPKKVTHRRRADPMVTLSSIFENIVNEMRDMEGHDTTPFQHPVNTKHVPDYYRVVKNPMSLQTVREGIRNRKYESRESFLRDLSLIIQNSELYNGPKSVLTDTSKKMLDLCLQRLAEKEEKLMKLEKAINPLLDDNDIVAFSYILETIVEQRLKLVEGSTPFHKPVNKKFVKDYYEVIERPMDIETLLKNVREHRYKQRDRFLEDVGLIYENSVKYNGGDSAYTKAAMRVREIAKQSIEEQNDIVTQYEENIRATEQAALDAAESDSVMTGTSLGTEQESIDTPAVVKPKKPKLSLSKSAALKGGRSPKKPGRKPKAGKKKLGKSLAAVRATTTIQNTSREDEFVDIEGDLEHAGSHMAPGFTQDYMGAGSGQGMTMKKERLAQDLQVTPDHSDMEAPKTPGGSDSEGEADSELRSALMEYDAANPSAAQPTYDPATYYGHEMEAATVENSNGGENGSFDPDKFFESWQKSLSHDESRAQGLSSGSPHQGAIVDDLQVSDSDSDVDFEEVG